MERKIVMNNDNMSKLHIGNFVADMPIIQGGMGVGISLSGLAAAVANEGGIGVISGVGLGVLCGVKGKDYAKSNKIALQEQIRKARKMTSGVLGVNFLMAVTDIDSLIQGAVEEKIDLLICGAGLFIRLPNVLPLDDLGSLHTKFVPIVSSSRSARITFESWWKRYHYMPDAVVVEGPLAGGHLGFSKEQISDPNYALDNLLPGVISVIAQCEQKAGKHIPVIAAGGIYTGGDIRRVLELGAHGVQMATRFVATDECDASLEFKEVFVECREEDFTIINSPVGLPGRAIRNEFLMSVERGEKKPFNCPWKCLKTCKGVDGAPYCIVLALINAKRGRIKNDGFVFAGANAYKVDKIIPVRELFETLKQEYIDSK